MAHAPAASASPSGAAASAAAAAATPELALLLQSVQRDINVLTDATSDRLTKRGALQRLRKQLAAAAPAPGNAADAAALVAHAIRPLLRTFDDPVEACREHGLDLVQTLWVKAGRPCARHDVLYLLVPALTSRLGAVHGGGGGGGTAAGGAASEPTLARETSEEIRMAAVRFLGELLRAAGRDAAPYVVTLVPTLRRCLADAFPDVQKETCAIVAALATAMPEIVKLDAAPLALTLAKAVLGHRHATVRVKGLHALGAVALTDDAVIDKVWRDTLWPMTRDASGQVKAALYETAATWLQQCRDRWVYAPSLLVLLLVGLEDPALPELQQRCRERLVAVGAVYERDYEDRVRGARHTSSDPALGLQFCLREHLSKIVDQLLPFLADWQIGSRLMAARAVAGLVPLVGAYVTGRVLDLATALLPLVGPTASDAATAATAARAVRAIGHHVAPAVWFDFVQHHGRAVAALPLAPAATAVPDAQRLISSTTPTASEAAAPSAAAATTSVLRTEAKLRQLAFLAAALDGAMDGQLPALVAPMALDTNAGAAAGAAPTSIALLLLDALQRLDLAVETPDVARAVVAILQRIVTSPTLLGQLMSPSPDTAAVAPPAGIIGCGELALLRLVWQALAAVLRRPAAATATAALAPLSAQTQHADDLAEARQINGRLMDAWAATASGMTTVLPSGPSASAAVTPDAIVTRVAPAVLHAMAAPGPDPLATSALLRAFLVLYPACAVHHLAAVVDLLAVFSAGDPPLPELQEQAIDAFWSDVRDMFAAGLDAVAATDGASALTAAGLAAMWNACIAAAVWRAGPRPRLRRAAALAVAARLLTLATARPSDAVAPRLAAAGILADPVPRVLCSSLDDDLLAIRSAAVQTVEGYLEAQQLLLLATQPPPHAATTAADAADAAVEASLPPYDAAQDAVCDAYKDLFWELLKRLDDASDAVRVQAVVCLQVWCAVAPTAWQRSSPSSSSAAPMPMPSFLDSSAPQASVHQTLLVHLDDPNPQVADAIMQLLTVAWGPTAPSTAPSASAVVLPAAETLRVLESNGWLTDADAAADAGVPARRFRHPERLQALAAAARARIAA
ncbi:hypothetical protein CXG81DRAFT_20389 [Caulochytrium protostelioides]|uniref:Dynein axonemal assembly factor 5 TPR repeats domain-containing protein n=1 Tax=Caulochytrium protostelioides TaxID=1555241 RepID=A0A4P9X3D5_9FUNG|nr:hypothetical protein CXG81DRAFT_20389 [Caulochytrium protostelioides]|eukprot:RKO99533.1 hypothetical protein CXG81DRAFT_20389 [Caulochytrium protostelioides]